MMTGSTAQRVRAVHATPAVLARVSALVEPELRSAVARLDPELAPIAEYHLGWVDARGRRSNGGGKGLRGTIAVLSAEAVGADARVAVPGAVAVELAHNYSLLHDDVIDGDRERRHRPTVWALYGVGPAVLVGDALLTLGHQVLLEHGRAGAAASARAVRIRPTAPRVDTPRRSSGRFRVAAQSRTT